MIDTLNCIVWYCTVW